MNFKLLAASAVLALSAAPVSAQLLGSGTIGGNLAGNIGGAVGGTLGGTGGNLGNSLGRDVGSATSGTLRGSASGRAERNVDTRSGRASGRAGASGGLDGSLGNATSSANGSANASKDAGFGIDAIGTDAVRGTVGGAVNTVTGAAGGLSVPALGSTSASGSGSGSGSGQASGGFGLGNLVAAGSAAANGAGAVAVEPGMVVRDSSGRAIGEVQTLRTTANGTVDAVVVEVGNRLATLPADNFTVSGDALVSAMSRGEVRREAQSQETGG
jgi:hypothetical protein